MVIKEHLDGVSLIRPPNEQSLRSSLTHILKTRNLDPTNQKEKINAKSVNILITKSNSNVDGLNENSRNTYLKFELSDNPHHITISIIDEKTDQIIRKIPEKDMSDIISYLESVLGLQIDERA